MTSSYVINNISWRQESTISSYTKSKLISRRKNVHFCIWFNLHFVSILIWLNIIVLLPKCESLRIIQVSVPRKSIVGDTVWLNCSYDLEQDTLYSINWYKDSETIYRFLPNNRPSQTVYDTEGLFIDVSFKCIFAFQA